MFCVGIDFGSTYTTVSVYREEEDSLVAKALTEGGTPFIPSVLTVKKNQTVIGADAKNMITTARRNQNVRCFRAFKMMLAEDDQERIQLRGFDQEYSPYRVSKEFLEILLKQIMEHEKEKYIDHLVIGVPEIWNNEITTVDGRAKLRDICRDFPFVDSEGIQIVSEPAAASAYCSYNFKKETGKNFEGNLLLIDYGGGTLDITLTDVETRPDETGKEKMEISILKRTGAGENEEGKVGQAGIVYMESLVEYAIKKAYPEQKVEYDVDFYKAVDEMEARLQTCTSMISDIFLEYGTDVESLEESEMDEDDYIFTEIMYKRDYIEIPYKYLVEVYKDVIYNIFDEKMEEVIAFMKDKGIDYMQRNTDQFKIVLAGGFGNYYLVNEQVQQKFGFNHNDMRQKNVVRNHEDAIKAISLGAALLSSGVIRIRKTAPYSIGVYAQDTEGSSSLTYGLYLNQDIEYNKIYFQRDESGHYVVLMSWSGAIKKFIINTHDDKRGALIVSPKEEFANKLSNIITNTDHTFVVGFSLDSSGVLSLHIYDYDYINDYDSDEDRISETGQKIELTNLRELFDIHVVEKAYKDE